MFSMIERLYDSLFSDYDEEYTKQETETVLIMGDLQEDIQDYGFEHLRE